MKNNKVNKQITIKMNYLYNMSYQILALFTPLITTPYVSRVLKAEGIGSYSFTLSIVNYFAIMGCFGFKVYGQLQIASERNNEEKISILFWEIFLAKCSTMILSMIIYVVIFLRDGQYKILYLILISYFISELIDISWFFQGLEQFKKIVIRNYIVKLLGIVLIFIVVKEKGDLYKYAIILNGSTLIGNITIWTYIRKYITKIKIKQLNITRHYRKCGIYFIPSIATSIYTILDKSMLGFIINSASESGYYEQAHKIEQICVTVVTSLSTVTLPRATYLYKERAYESIKELLNNSLNFVTCISIPMTFGLIGIADNLIPWFLGEGYSKCIILLKIFSILIIIIGLNNIVGQQCLMADGNQKQYNIGVILGAVSNIIINLFLISKLSSVGSAIGSVISEAVILCIFIHYSNKLVTLKGIFKMSSKYYLSGVIMSIVVYVVGCYVSGFLGICIQIFIGMIIYFGFIIILRDEFIMKNIDKVLKKYFDKKLIIK